VLATPRLSSAQHWILRPQDWGKNGVILLPPEKDSYSDLPVVTPPRIDRDGNIWSGSSRGPERIIGKATLKHDSQGRAYWVSSYRNSNGRVKSPVRAQSKYDKANGRIVIDTNTPPIPIRYRNAIDPNTGAAYRHRYVGSRKASSEYLGAATLRYDSAGRPFYQYGSDRVWATMPPRPQYVSPFGQRPYDAPQRQGFQQYGRQNHQNPRADVVTGVLQIINAALDQD
jgi:hypothetical protein